MYFYFILCVGAPIPSCEEQEIMKLLNVCNHSIFVIFLMINVPKVMKFTIYSERQKYGINSLKIKQNFFQKNLWTGQF
jgi:hypothetical protein